MPLRRLILGLALIVAPSLAGAQSVVLDGAIRLGGSSRADDLAVGHLDATLGLPLLRGLRLSAELGVYMFYRDGKNPHETYAALVWDDRLRLGAVRPAYDAVLPSTFLRAAPTIAQDRMEYTLSHATTEAARKTAVPWGLSYQDASGDLFWAISAHRAEKGDFTAASLALSRQSGPFQMAAGIEPVWDNSGSYLGTNAKLGGRWTSGPVDLGLAWLHPDANNRPDALALDAAVALADRITALAFAELTEAGQDDAYGLALQLDVTHSTALFLAGTGGAGDEALHLTVEHRF